MSQWYLVKLELAPDEHFPRGSPARAYLLRLPLTKDGEIEKETLTANPRAAFVRRYWPEQPDRSGTVRPNSAGWNLDFESTDAMLRSHLDPAPIVAEEIVKIVGLDGVRRPFRVMSVQPD